MTTSLHSAQRDVQRSVVPDSVLETYACESCNKYLTVGPLGLHPQGGNICGRCMDTERDKSALFQYTGSDHHRICNDSIPIPILAYATSRKNTFPCVNRYEGCREVLQYSEIEHHEKSCGYGTTINCPIPECSYKGIGSQLVQHYKKNHRTLYLEEPKFLVPLTKDSAHHYIYRQNGILFFVFNKFTRDQSMLEIDISQLPKNEDTFRRVSLRLRNKIGSSSILNTSKLFEDNLCSFKFEDVVQLSDHKEVVLCEFLITNT